MFATTAAITDVRYDFALPLIAACSVILLAIFALRRWIAAHSSGRLAQLRFRRLHGARIVELLGGRLDPQPGSPWIESRIDGRAIRLVAAPLDEGFQAGIELLEHEIPVNVWHTTGDQDELELPDSIAVAELSTIVAELHEAGVDSVTCGTLLSDDPRPPHIARVRFRHVAGLPASLARIAPLLDRLEGLATTSK